MSIYGQYTVPESSEMINLGVGQPRNNILEKPLNLLKKYMKELSEEDLSCELLQYGNVSGYERFRTKLAMFLKGKNYLSVEPNDLFQTNGATEAVSMITKLLTTSDDLVLVENPTYFLMINIFKELGRQVKPIEMEDDGLDVVALEKLLQNTPSYRKVLLYTIPFNHNPTGITLSNAKCISLCRILEKYDNLYILTDEVYQLLYFGDKIGCPLAELHKRIITVGSFSKVIAPAFRIGWVYSKNAEIINMLKNSATRDSSGGNNVLNSLIVEKMLDNNDIDSLLASEKLRLELNLSYSLKYLGSSVSEYFDIKIPEGGYFLWLKIKEKYGYLIDKFFENMDKFKVKCHRGNKFSINDSYRNYIRLSLSFYKDEEILLGLHRLVDCIKTLEDCFSVELDMQVDLTTNVGVFGASGRLGSLIMKELSTHQRYTGLPIIKNVSSELNSLKEYNIIIDVTSVDGTNDLLDKLLEEKHYPTVIVGTTGHKNFSKMRLFGSKGGKIFYMSNFSNGVRLTKEIIKRLNTLDIKGYDLNMIEKHHIHKKDKPSGTAKTLGEMINGIKIESIREGEVFGEHKLKLDNEYESIEIIHNAKKRELFSNGCVNFLDKLEDYDKGFHIL